MKTKTSIKKRKLPLTLLMCAFMAFSSVGLAYSARGILPTAADSSEPLAVKNLTVEYKENPLGIDEQAPLFGWQLTGGGRGVVQQHYLIQVSRSDSFTPGDMMWQSNKVESDKTSAIA